MYRRSEIEFGYDAGVGVLSLDRALPSARTFGRALSPVPAIDRPLRVLPRIDALPDLGLDVGSREWWQGLVACTALCAITIGLSPGLRTIPGSTPAPLAPSDWEASRSQAIAPLAWGADSGRRIAATDAVQPLEDTPERPRIDLTATVGQGDGLVRALERAGVAPAEAGQIAGLTSQVVPINQLKPGTGLTMTLGRRANRTQARPLEALGFRARFDMKLDFARSGGALVMRRMPIAIDRTPLRIDGRVGDSLYASARAAGAPAEAVQNYIRALAPKVPMGDLDRDARFQLVVEQARAATGEVEYGKLLYVGLERGDRRTRMIEWTIGGRTEWYDAAGVGQQRSGYTMPVAGARKTSGFGLRIHPLFGYSRFHQGVDYGAAHGTPIRAVTDGVVAFAGRHGGYGNMVKLAHAGGIGSGYAHMSRIAVTPGARVAQGQVIGYVGSTGFSTGPHLHFEVYRGGRAVNPGSANFATASLLSGQALADFRARLNQLVGS